MPVSIPGGTLTPKQFAEDVCTPIKNGIIQVITDILIPSGPPVEGEKLPIIKNRLMIDNSANTKWAVRLSSPRDIELINSKPVPRVHAVLVAFGGLSEYVENTVGHVGLRLRFTIDSYYQEWLGTDEDNADIRHNNEIAMTALALYQSKTLGYPNIVKRVLGFNERRALVRMGETIVRESLGEFYVEIMPAPLRAA